MPPAEKISETVRPGQFHELGWCRFPVDPELHEWATHALRIALEVSQAPEHATWWRYGGTWFAGVNVLPNDGEGRLAGGPRLGGGAVRFLSGLVKSGLPPWDRGQVSICLPGYQMPMAGESEGLFRYRRDRDAAHVDGLAAEGPQRRRFLREPHAFVLGIPLTSVSAGTSPLVVWEGSHDIMRQALSAYLDPSRPQDWGSVDLTDVYQAARQQVFDRCRRVEIPAAPGEAYVLHRLSLHGVAPWRDPATEDTRGRIVVYFRPTLPQVFGWIASP
jgi:hypothetical protein